MRSGAWIAALIFLFVLPVMATPLSDGLATNLIGYWQFNGTGADSSTLGNDLVVYGGAGYADGLFGQALDLQGDPSQYAARPIDDHIYDFGSSDFTVQAWVNYNSLAGEQTLVEKFLGPAGTGWTLTKLPGNQGHFWSQTSGVLWSSPMDLGTDEWHQIVIRQTDGQFEILLDTEITTVGITSSPIPDTSAPLRIGKRDGWQRFPTDGRIDEVAIWNRALTDAEISYLWNGGMGNQVTAPVPEPCTLALLGFGVLGLLVVRRR